MFDELVMVRAIGNQTPDDTLLIAQNVCFELGKDFVTGEYKNAAGKEDWPHVDSFCAARNLAFELGSGQYLFWADLDDVLTSGAELIREHAERGGYPCYQFPYAIFGRGITVMRDRMITKGAAKWKFAVHETFEFQITPQSVVDDRVVITHLPRLDKSGSNPRNLRILDSIPEEEMTTGLLYHYHVELALAGDIPKSVEYAKKVLAQPDLGRPEKYEVFLNLAAATEEPNQKAALLLQAYAANPGRREALFLLCNNAMNFGMPADGLAYALQMKATPKPAEWQWTDRKAVYGWVGEDLYAQALRANGYFTDAERVRLDQIKKNGMPSIALIHATKGRPEQAAKARKIWLDMASRPELVEHIFIFDSDDEDSHCLRRFHHLEIPPGGGCVAAWNHGLFSTTSPVVIQLSDDWTPPPQWDDAILQRIGDVNQSKVLAVSDGNRTDNLLCMAIATRSYLFQDCFMFHPRFKSVYSDNWFTEAAYHRQQVIEARDLVFTHSHPAFDSADMDATYAAQNSPERYAEGKAIFDELSQGGDWSSVPGFFDYFMFYDGVASGLKDGDTVAEVGVWMGRSIIYLAQALKRQGKNVKILAVDTFAGELNQPAHESIVAAHGGSLRNVFQANIERCGVTDMIEIIQGDSAQSAVHVKDGSLAFCFIDAAHDYDSVIRDIAAWRGKVNDKGIIAGHDIQWPEVDKAVKESFLNPITVGPCWAVFP